MSFEKTVALEACDSYDREKVTESVRRVFDACGGIASVVSPGDRVLVKINLLLKKTPDQAVTTHPEVVRAVAMAVKEAGGIPVLADSPGGPFTKGMLDGIYESAGIRQVSEETGAELNMDFSTTQRACEDELVCKRFDLIGVLDKVDKVITVGKLKTHGLTTMTACVKNLYGTVPGTTKVEYHARFSSPAVFSDMLVDLWQCVRPDFAILDAVVGMEGEGPSGGRPRKIGAVLGGKNAMLVDCVGADLIGLVPDQVLTLAAARRRGIDLSYETVGADPASLRVPDFDIPMKVNRSGWVHMVEKLPDFLRPRPVFKHDKCTKCGVCKRSCPGHAIQMNAQGYPSADLKKCIRCFCCQELCPQNDIKVGGEWIYRLLK